MSVVLDRVRFGFEDMILLTVVMVAFRALTGRMWLAVALTLAFFTVLIAREGDVPLLIEPGVLGDSCKFRRDCAGAIWRPHLYDRGIHQFTSAAVAADA